MRCCDLISPPPPSSERAFLLLPWLTPCRCLCSYGAMPYDKLQTAEVQRRVREGLRLDQPDGCSDNLYALMGTCWRVDRKARPTFAAIGRELATYQRSASDTQPRDIGATLRGQKL